MWRKYQLERDVANQQWIDWIDQVAGAARSVGCAGRVLERGVHRREVEAGVHGFRWKSLRLCHLAGRLPVQGDLAAAGSSDRHGDRRTPQHLGVPGRHFERRQNGRGK